MRRLIRSILNKTGGGSNVSRSEPQPEIIRLHDIPAEYAYLKKAKCRSCGGPTSASRLGSEAQNDFVYQDGRFVSGTMHDFWTITCTTCGAKRKLTIAVPAMDAGEVKIEDRNGSKWVTIDNRELQLEVIPSWESVKKRFAGQVIDRRSIRQEAIKEVFDGLELDKNLERVIRNPRMLLALGDLSLSEFFGAYLALCMQLAMKKNPGASNLTVQVPESVMRALNEPESHEALEEGLDFLLGGDD
jgi:hypothetical protein